MSKIVTLRDQIFEGVADYFGSDPAYYDVDGWALADSIISHTEIQKGDLRRYVVSDKFVFEYGVVVFKHRFSINRSLNDYEKTTLSRCIRMGVQYKYYTMACDKLIAEMQVLYKDDVGKLQCFKADLHDYTFEIKNLGNMMCHI